MGGSLGVTNIARKMRGNKLRRFGHTLKKRSYERIVKQKID